MITIVLPISRKDYLLAMFRCLDQLIRPQDTELLLIVDADQDVALTVDRCLDLIHYNHIQVVNFGDSPASELKDRRNRISEIHNFAKKYISKESDQVFLIEDDTVFQPEALAQLTEAMEKSGAVFAQGVEIGRWKTPYIGGWIADNIKNPKMIKSVVPFDSGVQEIDAGGLYCALVEAKVYLKHHFQPFDKVGTNGLSCDVNFGLWLRQLGMKVVMNWDVQCGHYKDGQQLRLSNVRPVVALFEKDDNNKWLATNYWASEEMS